jgi:ElaB/YqjD/DUF883 family membrane-anchored ribosome-binding protein
MTTRKNGVTADEIAAIEDLMSDLEKRLRRLGATAKGEASGAGSDINDFVSEALAGIMKRVRNSANTVSDTVTEEATRIGGDAVKRVLDEVEHRPLAMLAIAAGIGYLFGLSRR